MAGFQKEGTGNGNGNGNGNENLSRRGSESMTTTTMTSVNVSNKGGTRVEKPPKYGQTNQQQQQQQQSRMLVGDDFVYDPKWFDAPKKGSHYRKKDGMDDDVEDDEKRIGDWVGSVKKEELVLDFSSLIDGGGDGSGMPDVLEEDAVVQIENEAIYEGDEDEDEDEFALFSGRYSTGTRTSNTHSSRSFGITPRSEFTDRYLFSDDDVDDEQDNLYRPDYDSKSEDNDILLGDTGKRMIALEVRAVELSVEVKELRRENARLKGENVDVLTLDELLQSSNDLLNYQRKINEAIRQRLLCNVCFDRQGNVMLRPCGRVFCNGCARQLTNCATCRTEIESTERIFLV
eukprot:TRINITY_DN1759_c1_g2_i1.p1 TRINITY_DN1759_c1_g2~~TRINITY_DN1759_c1_g2_i1.p1  ORF type:complete len:345 (-),score=89.15 TRINITY_DN1759_c1_g2_i1:6-1040(-)